VKLGNSGAKVLKTVHLIFVVMWMGGAISWLPLVYGLSEVRPGTPDMYLHLRAIAWNVIGWGGIGSFTTGVALSLLTHWGLFKQLWTATKLALTMFCIPFGMFFVEATMLRGVDLTRSSAVGAVIDGNLSTLKLGLAALMVVFSGIMALAVFKPRAGLLGRTFSGLAPRESQTR
jgi:hypothetical protein